MTFSIEAENPTAGELHELYTAVGWTAYTAAPQQLEQAIAGSYLVLAARSTADKSLIGLARTISDGHTIAYLQDVLVAPKHQRLGVGRALISSVLDHSAHIRQVVLLTDAEHTQRAFYESCGFTESHDVSPPLRSFVRLS